MTISAFSGQSSLTQQTGGAHDTLTVGATTGGTQVSIGGTDGNRTLTGVANGSIAAGSTDAVNGGQLAATNTRVSAVETTTAQQGTRLNSVEGTVVKNEARLSVAEGTVVDHGTHLAALDGSVAELKGGVDALGGRCNRSKTRRSA